MARLHCWALLLSFMLASSNLSSIAWGQKEGISTWVDSTGKNRTEAEFKRLDGTSVVLLRSDGKEIKIPMDKLSKESQQKARDMAKAMAKAPPKREPKTDGASSAPSSEPSTPTEVGPVVQFPEDITAQQFLDILSAELAKDNVVAIWDSLPTQYQDDIEELYALQTSAQDPSLSSAVKSTAEKIIAVLREKKTFVLNNPHVKMIPPSQVDMGKLYDPLLNTLEVFVKGELMAGKKIEKGDFRKVVGSGANRMVAKARLMLPAFPMLSPAMVSNATKLKLDESASPSEPTINLFGRKIKLVKESGRWMAADMVNQWPTLMEQARQAAKTITPEMIAQQSAQVKGAIGTIVLPMITELKKAETQEQFDKLVEDKIGLVQLMIGGGPGGPGPGGPGGFGGPGAK